MAVFNPGVQSNDPNYLNYPRVLDAPEPDLSRAIAIKTLDQSITGTAKFADEAIKQGLSEKAHALVDPEREKFTAGLEQVKQQLDQGTIPAAVRSQNGSSVFDAHAETTDADLPQGVQSGIDRVTQLAMAYAGGSPKINDTQYSAATLAIAKQLRSQYPGYRDEVDAAVSKASGLPVANSYYQNLMTDINRQLVQMNSNAKKDPVGAEMLKNMDVPGDEKAGVPNMGTLWHLRTTNPEAYNRIGSNGVFGDAYVMKHISDWQNIKSQGQVDAQIRAQKDYDEKNKIDVETKNVTKRANSIIDFYINNNVAMSNMVPLRQLGDYFNQVGVDHKYNGVPQTDEEVEVRRVQLANYSNQIYQQLKRQTADSEPVIGAKAVEDIRQQAMLPIQGYMILAGGKDANPGLAGYHNRQIQNIKDDTQYNTLINKDTGAVSRMIVNQRSILGDQYFPFWIQKTPPEVQAKLDGLFQQEKLYAVSGEDPAGKGLPPRNIKTAIQHVKSLNDEDPKDVAQQIGGYIGMVTSITDPNMPQPMKDKLIEWGFGEKGRGFIDEVKQDYRDKDGNLVPGKFAALSRLGSPAVTNAVAESAKFNPENYQKYRGTMETEFGSAFRSELGDLNKIMQKPYLNAHFGWDDQSGHFILVDKNNRAIQPNYHTTGIENPNQIYLNSALEKLDRVNKMGIDNLVKVFASDPSANKGDIGNYLLKTLQTAGFRPGENITNASEGMAKAIIKTKKPEITLDEMDKVLGLK